MDVIKPPIKDYWSDHAICKKCYAEFKVYITDIIKNKDSSLQLNYVVCKFCSSTIIIRKKLHG